MDKNTIIVIGKLGSPYGIKGYMKIHMFTELQDYYFKKEWFIRSTESSLWGKTTKKSFLNHNGKTFIRVNSISKREQLSNLVNALVGIKYSCLKPLDKNEIYLNDIIGMDVINRRGYSLGSTENIIETGANKVICSILDKQEYLIPFTGKHVISIDKTKRNIIVDWEHDY